MAHSWQSREPQCQKWQSVFTVLWLAGCHSLPLSSPFTPQARLIYAIFIGPCCASILSDIDMLVLRLHVLFTMEANVETRGPRTAYIPTTTLCPCRSIATPSWSRCPMPSAVQKTYCSSTGPRDQATGFAPKVQPGRLTGIVYLLAHGRPNSPSARPPRRPVSRLLIQITIQKLNS